MALVKEVFGLVIKEELRCERCGTVRHAGLVAVGLPTPLLGGGSGDELRLGMVRHIAACRVLWGGICVRCSRGSTPFSPLLLTVTSAAGAATPLSLCTLVFASP